MVEPVEPLELKGKAERVPAFRLVEVTLAVPALARHLDSPLVGREEELARLERALDEAVAQVACRVATVMGDAGLGKSRLVTEFADRVGGRGRVLWSRCLPYGEGITFWPIAELVKAAARIGEEESQDAARAKVRELVGDADDGELVANLVEAAIGLGGGDAGAGDIRETFWAVRRLLELLAEDRPLVVVVEDIHWAEPTLLDLLQYVGGFSTDHAVLALCTTRPELRERRPDWSSASELVVLQPLSDAECELLIANLLGRAGLSGDVRERITEAAEGNPLFVEEMLRKLIDDGLLERDNGDWSPRGDLSRITVPASINALLAARLDQLELEERAVIQRASVVGKTFWWGAVSELSPEDERPRVGSNLQTLLRKELVRPDRSRFAGEDAFRFSHILVRDAAYGSMPKRTRAELHEHFASWLERKAGDRIAEFEEILGYHLEHAYRYRTELGPVDDPARAMASAAAERLGAAGRRALVHWDVSAAVNLLARAAELLQTEDLIRVALLTDLGMALAQSDIPRADAVLGEAVDAARALNDPLLEARAGVRRVFVRLLLDPQVSQSEALADGERFVKRFEELGDDAGVAEGSGLVGMIRFWQGRSAESETEFERGLEHARRAGDRRQEGEILRRLTLVIAQGPIPAKDGLARLDRVLEESRGDRRVEIGVARARAQFEAMQGRHNVARGHIARGKDLAGELGDQVALSAMFRDSGYVEMSAGDPAAAERELREGYDILERIGDFGHLASLAPDLGEAICAQGRFAEGLEVAEFSERITIPGDTDAWVRGRKLRATALAGLGRLEEAELAAVEAVRVISQSDYLELHAFALLTLADVLSRTERKGEAASAIRGAIDLFRRKGNAVDEARATAWRAELEA